MFSKKCFCKGNISKIVRPLLAALSVNGLITIHTHFNNFPPFHNFIHLLIIAPSFSHFFIHSINKLSFVSAPSFNPQILNSPRLEFLYSFNYSFLYQPSSTSNSTISTNSLLFHTLIYSNEVFLLHFSKIQQNHSTKVMTSSFFDNFYILGS